MRSQQAKRMTGWPTESLDKLPPQGKHFERWPQNCNKCTWSSADI